MPIVRRSSLPPIHQWPTQPLVSVILPAYNAAAFLVRTLQSILHQTYGNFEVIVVDDGSQDRTADIVQALMVVDARIRLYQQANAGVAAARNKGIQLAQGVLIAPIDADDIWYPDYLEKLVYRLLQSSAEVGVVYAWSQDIDGHDRPTGGFHVAHITGNVYRTLLCHNFLGNASATMIWRHCFEQVGDYDCAMRNQQAQGCEDWDLYLRLAACYQFAVVPEFLVGYRKLTDSMSGNGEAMARSQALMLEGVKARSPEIPDWYYGLSRSSFYLYLAYQTVQPPCTPHRLGLTQHWLNQAKQAHYWVTMLRPSWYLMSLKLISSQGQPIDTMAVQTDAPVRPRTSTQKPNRVKLWCKVWITSCLHTLLSIGQFAVPSKTQAK